MAATANDYIELRKDVEEKGLLKHSLSFYLWSLGLYILLSIAGFVIAVNFNNWTVIILVSIFFSFVFMQFAYIGHDAGHKCISNNNKVNETIGYFCHTFMLGASFAHWKNKHSRHHSNPNHENMDPDIDNDPFSFSKNKAENQKGISRIITRFQSFLLPFVFIFMLFIMRGDSFKYMAKNKKSIIVDVVLMIAHYAFFLGLVPYLIGALKALVMYAIFCSILGLYFGFSFIPNHVGMPVLPDDNKLSFVEKQVITSRDIKNNRFLDFIFGGLNYQIEHHLFPTAPRTKLKHIKPIVKKFCYIKDIPYKDDSVAKAWKDIFSYLNQIGKSARRIKLKQSVLDMV